MLQGVSKYEPQVVHQLLNFAYRHVSEVLQDAEVRFCQSDPVFPTALSSLMQSKHSDEQAQDLPNNAEDRKAAAALNSLNANAMSQENGESAAKQPSAADQEALGKAMSRLEIASGGVKKSDGAIRSLLVRALNFLRDLYTHEEG